jgi:outer membrane protein
MAKFLLFLMLAACSAAFAQTPAANPMPDGSRDMYLGVAVLSRPFYEGATSRKIQVTPVMQIQWSNGLFVSGTSAGIHLSDHSEREFGPLIAVSKSRTAQDGGDLMIITDIFDVNGVPNNRNKLLGMEEVKQRPLIGGFYNINYSRNVRFTNSLFYGDGNQRNGLRMISDVMYNIKTSTPHQTLALSLGLTVVNQQYNQAYFGVTRADSIHGWNPVYTPSSGVKDIHAALNWNWVLSKEWLLISALHASSLQGSASNSPLVEQKTNLTVSGALAFRF